MALSINRSFSRLSLSCRTGVSDTVSVWIPGKLVDFSPLCVGAIVGIYRSEGLEPQFIVIRCSRRLRGEFSF
jgi:hypothetical protein